MIPFNATELNGLLELLRDCPGRVAAAVVPGVAGGEALIARLRDALPGLRLEVAEDAAEPGQLGARAEALGRGVDSLFVVPVDERRLETEAERVDFWRRLNHQRERLASGAVRTCLVLDEANEKALAMVADDLWDWAMVFRFPEAVALREPPIQAEALSAADENGDPGFEGEIVALRARLQRAREVGLPSGRVAREFVAPLFVKLASAGRTKEARELWDLDLRRGDALAGVLDAQYGEIRRAAALIGVERRPPLSPDTELLANTLAILVRKAAPLLHEWGGHAAESALKDIVGERAKQAAETLGWLKPRIEGKPIAKASVELLAGEDLDDEDASDANETLKRQLVRLLKADQDLAATLLEKLDGLEVRSERRAGGNETSATPAEAPAAKDGYTARDAYLRWVMERAGFLALGGVDPAVGSDKDRRLPLRAVYTALTTCTPRRSEAEFVSGTDLRSAIGQRDEPPLSALEQLDRHKRLVLLGDPGSGKSTFVDFVALCMAGELLQTGSGLDLALLTSPLPDDAGKRQPWSHGALLPVRVVLRDFASRGLPTEVKRPTPEHLWGFLEAELREGQQAEFLAPLKKALKQGEALVLLDGLDEVPEAEKRRKLICEAVIFFVEAYPKCRFVVTSRTFAYQKQDFHLTGFDVAELAPFGAGQIRLFTRRWYAEVTELKGLRQEEAKDRAALLERAIFSSSRLRELAARPLLLTLMASLHAFRGGSLPEDREKLYDETLELLLDVWEQRQKHHAGGRLVIDPSLLEYLKVERRDVLRVLQELAYEVHTRQPVLEGTADVPAAELVGRLMRLQPRTRNTDVNPRRLAEFLSQRSGILAERGEGVFTFPHRTIQEYLAARHLIDGRFDYDEIARDGRQDPDRWREVILLAAARMGPMGVWELADALAFAGDPPDPRADAWGLHLAGYAVAESAKLEQVSPRNLERLKTLRQRLAGLLTSPELPASERAAAGNNLACLGDLRFDEEAWHLPADPTAGFVAVPGCVYIIGSDPEQDPEARDNEQPQHMVKLSPFWIARWPVTVAQFHDFVKASGFEIGDENALKGVSNHPVVWVSWDEAVAYCGWLTERLHAMAAERAASSEDPEAMRFWQGLASGEIAMSLPTEAQWEAAARGHEARHYPWGEESPTQEHANFGGSSGATPVGIYPRGRGPFGTEDQAGNVAEWCVDVWEESAHTPVPRSADEPSAPGSNPQQRSARGGSWEDGPEHLRAASRFGWSAGYRSWFRGFRVCVSAPGAGARRPKDGS